MLNFAAPAAHDATLRRQVATLDRLIVQAGQQHRERVAKLDGERDKLMARLLDSEGAHDRHPVAVR